MTLVWAKRETGFQDTSGSHIVADYLNGDTRDLSD